MLLTCVLLEQKYIVHEGEILKTQEKSFGLKTLLSEQTFLL